MSLHFIFGRAGTGKTCRCCREIRDYVTQNPGSRAYLLVPDQCTYTAEYHLAQAFPGEGFVDVTVSGFSRLAYRVFQEVHSPVSDALSPLGQQIIIRRLLETHKEQLQMIVKVASQPHFSEELTNFFHQLDMFCISEDDMVNAAEAEGDTPLGKKLSDLSLLYQAYHQYLKDHFSYQGSLFDLLAREIPKSEKLRHSRIWIDGFNGMAPQKINIVSALIHTAEEVTVTLQMDTPDEAAENTNFSRPFHLYSLLQEKERRSSAIHLTEDKRFHNNHLIAMARSFFAPRPQRCLLPAESNPSVQEGLHLLTASNKEEEVDGITRTIMTLVRDRGLRYRDVLVLLRTPDNYNDLFEQAFQKYDIPGFIDKKHPMNNHPLVMLLDFLLRFLAQETKRTHGGWQLESLFRLLKTGLLPVLTQEEIDQLENYTLTHRIRSWQWHAPWTFRTYRDLDKEPPPMTEAELAELREANGWRETLTTLLDPMADAWKQAVTGKDRCTLLYQWLVQEKIPDTLAALDEKEWQETHLRPHLQVWKKILSLLEEIVHVAGNDPLDANTFLSIFEDGLSALTYSTIPPSLDHVTVTGMDRGYAMEAKVVFVPGAVEGEFPKRIEEGGFFTELEKQQIYKNSQLLFGNWLMDMVHQEQFYAYLALTRSSEALYLSYPSLTSDGQETSPSYLVSQLSHLNYFSEKKKIHGATMDETDRSFFSNPKQALSLLPSVIRESTPQADSPWTALASWAWSKPEEKPLLLKKLSSLSYANEATMLPKDLAAPLFKPGGRFFSSVTKLENYRNCPYQYYLQYGLGLSERDDGKLNVMDMGNYLHAGLHQFGSALKNHAKDWKDATDEDISQISDTIASHLAPKIKFGILDSDGASRYTERNLKNTFKNALSDLRSWSQHSAFHTEALEKEFYLHIHDGTKDSFTLKGKIDRIDRCGEAAAIFDYKTGHTKATLQEIVSGLKLQLLTYLLALSEDKENHGLLPAALMYIYLSGDVKSTPSVPPGGEPTISKKEMTSGFLLQDVSVLKDLDSALGEDDSYLSVRLKKDGELYSSTSLLTEDDFQALLSIVKEKLISLYTEMSEGQIPIRPTRYKGKSPCTYCPYHAICRFDPNLPGEGYEYINMPSDAELKKQLESLAEKSES